MIIVKLYLCPKAPFSNCFPFSNENEKPGFSNSSGLKSVFGKLRFRAGLVWTLGQTVELKLCFQLSLRCIGHGIVCLYTNEA